MNIKEIKNGVTIDICSDILKFVIEVIINKNINDEVEKKILITAISNLINASSELIIVRKNLKLKNYSFFSFLPFCR